MKTVIPDTLCLTGAVEVFVVSFNGDDGKVVLKLNNDLAVTFNVLEGDGAELVGKKAILNKDGSLVEKPAKQKVDPERKTSTGCNYGEKLGSI